MVDHNDKLLTAPSNDPDSEPSTIVASLAFGVVSRVSVQEPFESSHELRIFRLFSASSPKNALHTFTLSSGYPNSIK